MRRLAPKGTELAEATVDTIRTKLVKIGAVIESKLSLIRIHLSSYHPLQDLFRYVARVLCPG